MVRQALSKPQGAQRVFNESPVLNLQTQEKNFEHSSEKTTDIKTINNRSGSIRNRRQTYKYMLVFEITK